MPRTKRTLCCQFFNIMFVFPSKYVLIRRSLKKKFEWGRLVSHMAAKLKVNFFVLRWVAFLVSEVTLPV